jgi:hypothetical protein
MFTLDQVVPWGRSFDEYARMFALTRDDLDRRILGCGDGPAAFNAEATRRGARVVSCDPIYRWSDAEIERRVAETAGEVLAQTRVNAAEFIWGPTTFESPEALGEARMRAMRAFLADYDAGKAEGRYVDAGLPSLPFADDAFDLAVSSHFLFLYSRQFDAAFHRAALLELLRVAAEIRVFPLLALGGTPSEHVEPCTAALREAGFAVTIDPVEYEFQRGGNAMLRARRSRAVAT